MHELVSLEHSLTDTPRCKTKSALSVLLKAVVDESPVQVAIAVCNLYRSVCLFPVPHPSDPAVLGQVVAPSPLGSLLEQTDEPLS